LIKRKKKLCNGCEEMKMIWKNHKGERYCKQCWLKRCAQNKHNDSKPTNHNNAPHRINKQKKKNDYTYSKLRKEFLKNNDLCEAHITGICTIKATDIHHMKGRGVYYLKQSTWLPVCRSCHIWIEEQPKKAKELGFSENRLTLQ